MTATRTVSLDDTVAVAKNQVAAEVGGELVILNVANGEYFGLNAVGARIWALIETPKRVGEVRDQLLLEYADVTPDVCTADLLALLAEMHGAGLIELAASSAE
jgi:hypothetical protein